MLSSFSNALLNLSVKDIRLEFNRPIEEIMNKSVAVMTTVGEWQLIEITGRKESRTDFLNDHLIFHVCLLFICKGIIQLFFMITKGKTMFFFIGVKGRLKEPVNE